MSIARGSVRAVGDVALNAAEDLEGIIERLLQYFDSEIEHVTAETIIAVSDILRKRPTHADQCIQTMQNIDVIDVVDAKARAALVWIYGEYGENIPLAPYYLEPVLTNLADESNVTVRMQSLSCAMKLFFKRPPEMQAMLGAALLAGSRDLNQEVHDLARFYYRLLEKDARAAERVVNSRDKSAVHTFKESVMEEKTFDKVFTEFNTLSVLYGRPAETFVDSNATTRRRREEEDDDLDMNKQDVDAGAASLLDHSDMIDLGSDNASASGGSTVDLLAMLDVNVAEPAPQGPFALDPSPTLDAPSFQAKWTTASLIASGIQAKMRSSAVASTADVTARLAPLGVATMAVEVRRGDEVFLLRRRRWESRHVSRRSLTRRDGGVWHVHRQVRRSRRKLCGVSTSLRGEFGKGVEKTANRSCSRKKEHDYSQTKSNTNKKGHRHATPRGARVVYTRSG